MIKKGDYVISKYKLVKPSLTIKKYQKLKVAYVVKYTDIYLWFDNIGGAYLMHRFYTLAEYRKEKLKKIKCQ